KILEPQLEYSSLNRFMSREEIEDVIKRYGTPLYIVDEDTMHRKVRELLDAYKGFKGSVDVAYSIKANFTPAVIKAFIKDHIMFDITSLGELYFYKRLNGNKDKVIYTSVTEEYEEYLQVLKEGIDKVVVSSYNGLLNLRDAAKALDLDVNTIIRINPEVGVKASIRASYRDGKFGVPLHTNTVDNASNILKHIMNSEHLKFDGFHFHLGSQITDYTCYSNALAKLDQFIIKMKKVYPNLTINTLDIGGGIPIFYGNKVPAPSEIASSIIDKLNHIFDKHGNFHLIIESGRYLIAESMILLSKVVNIKEYNNDKFAILDSGYHLLLDAALLKQPYPQEIINNNKHKDTKRIHLAGRLCDTYDIFPRSKISRLDNIDTNSYVIFYNVGAYSIVFNMPFHCQTKPAILMKDSNDNIKLIRKQQSIEELFKEEGGDLV
ncbi:MAG: hypothetical protein D6752_00960, partial [Candidatus Nitrosothermus koennekii]